jgi:hypothetical protein
MPPNATELATMLDSLQPGQLDKLPRAALERLSDACYRAHALCEQAAGEQAFSRVVRRPDPPKLYVADDAKERLNEPPKAGFVAELADGRGRE